MISQETTYLCGKSNITSRSHFLPNILSLSESKIRQCKVRYALINVAPANCKPAGTSIARRCWRKSADWHAYLDKANPRATRFWCRIIFGPCQSRTSSPIRTCMGGCGWATQWKLATTHEWRPFGGGFIAKKQQFIDWKNTTEYQTKCREEATRPEKKQGYWHVATWTALWPPEPSYSLVLIDHPACICTANRLRYARSCHDCSKAAPTRQYCV